MKLYITEELNFKTRLVINDVKEAQEIVHFLSQFGVKSKIGKDNFIIIESQKVSLDEIAMNELFDKIFHMFSIEYSCMGGAGCDFSLNVKLLD